MKVCFPLNLHFGSLDTFKARTIYGSFIPAARSVVLCDTYEKSDDVLTEALDKLSTLKFSNDEIKKVQRYGAKPVFKSGKEALDFAKEQNISIVFGKVDQPDIHAQWQNDKNTIVINELYRENRDEALVYAISAALLHELAHAKDKDGISSIQEEIDCLAMNALAFNEYKKQNPTLFQQNASPIIKDGVALYADLFMGNDEGALVDRVRLKYGNLKTGSPNHEPQKFALKVANL